MRRSIAVYLLILISSPIASAHGDALWNRVSSRKDGFSRSASGRLSALMRLGLRGHWDARGLRIVQEGNDSVGGVRLEVVSWGRNYRRTLLPPSTYVESPSAQKGGRAGAVLSARRGDVTEWWRRHPQGLEQGFVVQRRPPGREPLVLDLAVSGAMVSIDVGQRGAWLHPPSGPALRYADLRAWDRRGTTLPARMAASPRGIKLIIDDAGAHYPLDIDPVLTPVLLEQNRAWAELGFCVASAGDVNGDGYADVIAGAPYFQPRAFGPDIGKIFLFNGTANGLSPNSTWSIQAEQDYARLGLVVASAGDVNGDGFADVLAGAPYLDSGGADAGRAYLYLGKATGLSKLPAWTATGDRAGALLGAVASAGDVNADGYSDVLVGAPNRLGGTAYLYMGSAAGLSQTPSWSVSESQSGASFGFALASAGDVNGDGFADVIVGAYGYAAGGTEAGRVLVYHGSRSGLSHTENWSFEGDLAEGKLGVAVAAAGDVNGDGYGDVVVSAPTYGGLGRVYVFLGSRLGLSAAPAWQADGDQAAGWFGSKVAGGDFNGDGYGDVIVGAHQHARGETGEGRVYLYYGSPTGLSRAPAWTAEPDQPGAAFGLAVASAGDVNGDQLEDLVVGAPFYENQEMEDGEGAVFAYLGCTDPDRDGVCGGAAPDGGLAFDGGLTSDGGVISDGGTTLDGGGVYDGGAQDGGSHYDGGSILDGGLQAPDGGRDGGSVGPWPGSDAGLGGGSARSGGCSSAGARRVPGLPAMSVLLGLFLLAIGARGRR